MQLRVDVNVEPAVQACKALAAKLPHIIADSLNRTGDDANQGIRNHMMASFVIRNKALPRFVAPMRIPRSEQAKPGRLYVILHTEGKGRILDPFEAGTPKVMGANPIAVPTSNIRFTKATVIPRKWYPSNLGLTPKVSPTGQHYYALGKGAIKEGKTPFKQTKGGVTQIKGKNRTFVLDPKLHKNVSAGEHGVYVRIGSGRGDIRMIWQYRTQVRRPPNLKFKETANRIAQARWPINMRGVLDAAIRGIATARPRRG